jgi:hypothetical protein
MFNKSVSEDFEQARKDFNYALEELVTPSQHIIGIPCAWLYNSSYQSFFLISFSKVYQ